MPARPVLWATLALALVLLALTPALPARETSTPPAVTTEVEGHPVPHVAWTLPFVALLLAIAVLPLTPHAHHWWEVHLSKLMLALVLGELVLIYYGVRGYGYHGASPGAATVFAVLEHALLR